MPQNLVLRTGSTNLTNVSKIVTTPILLTGTAASTAILQTIPITLNNINSSVLLTGTITFTIQDTVADNTIGPLSLQILRSVNGVNTIIYRSDFLYELIPYLTNLNMSYQFGFQWIDNPSSSLCPDPCLNSTDTCVNSPINYTFQIATLGLPNTTQSAGLVAQDYYSLTLVEISK
ncbi:hypothetical protein IRP63_08455 [Clostridium botulinum]|uniref:DUF4489 domain-containing protein n=1 Tax=Clostridium botulinum C/D str. DC5 TaxID=1443128 RepID=A0A0A0IDR5_CLOBO|nr:hypothetical protein [Clostridium botulinum]KEI01337.1 hypothetical protein Z952_12425 [Clostridium botulinum C/D str. BKT75002]KEI12810.1 hypothetical protein Z954_04950 [Clostridium botulinum C/D str. BKT2873]KGM93558.1 hypothetical protein Z956_11270 [Clostridium botulinum D str. CCUG 7971]KGM98648.1 hypothetical protein Z955_10815 [Clostridium botulinum C/D str. DC5]KOC45734.1 hypothetical protein ADU88_13460 [Clostridium botulinum]